MIHTEGMHDRITFSPIVGTAVRVTVKKTINYPDILASYSFNLSRVPLFFVPFLDETPYMCLNALVTFGLFIIGSPDAAISSEHSSPVPASASSYLYVQP